MAIDGAALSNTIKANLDTQLGDSTFSAERQKLASAIGQGVAAAHNADPSGPTFSFVDGEVPAGTVNGTNAAFTLAQAPAPTTSLHLYLNGVRLRPGTHFTLSGNTITYVAAHVPQTGDEHYADYRF